MAGTNHCLVLCQSNIRMCLSLSGSLLLLYTFILHYVWCLLRFDLSCTAPNICLVLHGFHVCHEPLQDTELTLTSDAIPSVAPFTPTCVTANCVRACCVGLVTGVVSLAFVHIFKAKEKPVFNLSEKQYFV